MCSSKVEVRLGSLVADGSKFFRVKYVKDDEEGDPHGDDWEIPCAFNGALLY